MQWGEYKERENNSQGVFWNSKYLPELEPQIHLGCLTSAPILKLLHAFYIMQERDVLHFSQIDRGIEPIVSLASLVYQKQASWQILEVYPKQDQLQGPQTFKKLKLSSSEESKSCEKRK